jgi:hypothetical protein
MSHRDESLGRVSQESVSHSIVHVTYTSGQHSSFPDIGGLPAAAGESLG